MIPILLIIVVVLLLTIGLFLSRKGATFIGLLASEDNYDAALRTITSFSRTCLILSGVGVIALLFNHQTISLIYICIIMIISAGFSLSLAKKIA